MVDGNEVSRRGTRNTEVVPLLFVALTVVVLAQSTRPLFPIMFEIGEDWDFVLAGLVALGAFSAPLLVAVIPRLPLRTPQFGGAGLMAAGLLVARLFDPISALIAILVAVGALLGATMIVAQSDLGTKLRAPSLAGAVVLGLAIDVGVRAAFGSWDLVWQSGVGSLVVVVGLATGLVGLALLVSQAAGVEDPVGTPPSVWVGAGAFFFLQLLFLQNYAFVGSQAQVSASVAVFSVLAADAVALAIVGWGPRLTLPQAGGLVVAVVALAWVLPLITGIGVALAVVALQSGLGLLFARAVSRFGVRRRRGRRAALAVAGGSLLYLALVLLWSLHIDQPLPVPRQTLPAFGALIVGIVSLRGATSGPKVGIDSRAGIAIVLGLVVAAPLWLLSGVPDLDEEGSLVDGFKLVNYNVRGSVGIDGQLAPDRIVDEILSSDPDIVVVQEAARGWPIHGTMDLVSYLQRELGMDFVYVAAADGQFGNAVFSKRPMTEVDRGLLPKDGSQDRAYVLLRFDVGGSRVYIAGTHLHPRSTVQVEALLDAVGDVSPLVVAGDMNIAPDDPEVALFREAGLIDTVGATGDECRTTSAEPTSNCDRPDWVFTTHDLQVEELRIGSGGASDHLAIHVTLRPSP